MVSRKLVAGALIAAAILVAMAAAAAIFRPDRAIRVATGYVAHNVCSKSFVSGLDPQTVFCGDHRSRRHPPAALGSELSSRSHRPDRRCVAGGTFGSRAAFHEGLGCVLLHGPSEPYLLRSDFAALKTPKSAAAAGGDRRCRPWSNRPIPALKAALDHAFEEPAEPPFRRTKAVVVVHDGRVIAERYADGIGVDTPLLGFSMTKSVINALIGILTQQGVVTPSFPAPIPEWRAASDPRREIEVEHLMRMTTGLALDETNSGFDPSSQMVYLHNDMAGFAVKAAMIAPPGKRWAYSSPTTQLLARIIRDAVGGPEQTLAFAWRELFNPLGMRNVTLEFDGVGTLQGSTYMLASARDWARFGLLYLNDGVVGGRRILQEDWVDFSALPPRSIPTMAPASGPIAASIENAKGRVRLGIPRDAFFASGDLGQRIVIIPIAASGDRPSRRLRRSHRRYSRAGTSGQ